MGIAEMRIRSRVVMAIIAAGIVIAFLAGCGTSGNYYTVKKGQTTKLDDISVTKLTPNVAKSASKQTAGYMTRSFGTRTLSVTLSVTKLPGTSDTVKVAIKGANPSSAILTAGQGATFNLELSRNSSKTFTPTVTYLPATLGKATKNPPNAVTLSGSVFLN